MHTRLRRSKALVAALATVVLPFCAVGTSQASEIFNFTDFSTACGTQLSCVGYTAASGTALRLTPAVPGYTGGAAYSTTAVTLGAGATFSTTFQFRFTDPGGIDPADGIVFVLGTSTTGLGSAGFGIGYSGLGGQSIGIEFDTYNNGGTDISNNHVAVDVNGALSNFAAANAYGVANCDLSTHTQAGCMSNGDIWSVTIGYDGTTGLLNVYVQDGSAAPQNIISDYAVDIADDLGTNLAYVGFTSATGAGWENHDILGWQLNSDIDLAMPPAPSTGVPEPLPLGLAGIGLVAMMAARRRR